MTAAPRREHCLLESFAYETKILFVVIEVRRDAQMAVSRGGEDTALGENFDNRFGGTVLANRAARIGELG